MGGSYEFVRYATANLREKDDSLNTALGGFVAGNILGLRCRSHAEECICLTHTEFMLDGTTPAVLGFGAMTAIIMGAYDYGGGALTGYKKDHDVDEFERKEHLRKNRRRPLEETISELGEGRGTILVFSEENSYLTEDFRNLCARL